MKRILSLALISVMLVLCFVLSSCSMVSEKDLQKDPQAVLGEAIENTTTDFFKGNNDLNKVIAQALEKGSLTVSLEADALDEAVEDLSKISEKVYFDKKNNRIVADTSVTVDGEDLTARLFIDKNGVIVNGESFLGSDESYALNIATFIENFETSGILTYIEKMIGQELSDDAIADIIESFEKLQEKINEALSDEEKEEEVDLVKEVLKVFESKTSEEELTDEYGKTTKCVAITYTITLDAIREAVDNVIESLSIEDEETLENIYEIVDEFFNDFEHDQGELECEVKIYLNSKTGKLAKASVNGTYYFTDYDYTYDANMDTIVTCSDAETTFKGEALFSDKEITVSFRVNPYEDSIFGGDIIIANNSTEDKTSYSIIIDGCSEGISFTIFNLTYSYDKTTGDILLVGKSVNDTVDLGEPDDITSFKLQGKLIMNKNTATLKFISASFGEISVKFNLVVEFNSSDDIPVAGESTDIIDLEYEDIEAILEELEQSEFATKFDIK